MPLLDANGIPNKPIPCGRLIGAHTHVSPLQELKPHRCVRCHATMLHWRKVGIKSNAKPADLIMTSLTAKDQADGQIRSCFRLGRA